MNCSHNDYGPVDVDALMASRTTKELLRVTHQALASKIVTARKKMSPQSQKIWAHRSVLEKMLSEKIHVEVMGE